MCSRSFSSPIVVPNTIKTKVHNRDKTEDNLPLRNTWYFLCKIIKWIIDNPAEYSCASCSGDGGVYEKCHTFQGLSRANSPVSFKGRAVHRLNEVPARGSLWPVGARAKSLGGFSLFFLWNNLLSSSARNVILRRHKGKKNIKKLNP